MWMNKSIALLRKLFTSLARRLIVYRLGEFVRVWEAANRICDSYHLKEGQSGRDEL
jgi:hypothetical protein